MGERNESDRARERKCRHVWMIYAYEPVQTGGEYAKECMHCGAQEYETVTSRGEVRR